MRKGLSILLALTMITTIFSFMAGTVSAEATDGYRNVALRRMVYHSCAANYNETGHLVTDGIIDTDGFTSAWISGTNGKE